MADCWVERVVERGERFVLQERGGPRRWSVRQDQGRILRCAQDDRRGKRVFVGRELRVIRKKQIPRSARNDNLQAFQRVVRRVVGTGLVAGRTKVRQ